MANYALLEWPENIDISDTAPMDYVPKIKKQFKDKDEEWREMLSDHALPENWEAMAYPGVSLSTDAN